MSSTCSCGHPDAHADDCEGASLFSSIDLPRIRCLNEKENGSCRRIFKPLAERRDHTAGSLRSNDDDPDLLIVVPFDNAVRLKSICISGSNSGAAPARLKVYANREDIDFASASETAPTQEFDLPEDVDAELWHPVRAAKFGNITCLTLLFEGTHGADESEIFYVGFKGVATGYKRQIVEAVYEARPQLSDHEVRADAGAGRMGL